MTNQPTWFDPKIPDNMRALKVVSKPKLFREDFPSMSGLSAKLSPFYPNE